MNTTPYDSLGHGHWFKLILGASFQHLPAIESLALIWSLAGVDCLDMGADPAVIAAVERGLARAQEQAEAWGQSWQRPWLMVSLNDGEDPHFRKAYFPSADCPDACPRPCIKICPTQAIDQHGVNEPLCYGCGRCQPVCPLGLIDYRANYYAADSLGYLLAESPIEAIEIHTHTGNFKEFEQLWQGLAPVIPRLQLISISFPDHAGLQNYLEQIAAFLSKSNLQITAQKNIIWQTDGIPMSGDQGASRAKASISLARKVLSWSLPGHVQLAGGTNQHSLTLAQAVAIAGIAYGSYARKQVEDFLVTELTPSALRQAVDTARHLVHPLKAHYQETTYDAYGIVTR